MSSTIKVRPVILCGGSGTRLWPLSRSGFPKQFLVLTGTTSLFQQALERVNDLAASDINVGGTLVVTNEEHRFLALDQLRELKHIEASLLLEPSGRNTAPALTIAALEAMAEGDDPVLVVTPADQTVQDATQFKETLQRAVRVAANGSIVILGITPDRPETGYGYIRCEGSVGSLGEYAAAEFVEKPNLETAEKYLADGHYSWNGGMFVLRASVWLKALKQFRADIAQASEKAWSNKRVDAPFIRPDQELFLEILSESIDYAVMEKCLGSDLPIKMVSLDAGWNDLGAWDAVWQVSQADASGNVTYGDVILKDTQNTFVHATNRLVATVGLQDVVIIETADAVLVADKTQAQQVKKIVQELELQKRQEKDLHRKVHRPWGWYDSIEEGKRFKVKRILVKPGASLSLQMHHHRAEHWIVVKGVAEITNGIKVMILGENQSTYIPRGQIHRLVNHGSEPLEIIEVQSGEYLGEDDIVRLNDSYGRN
jgi:mannose-1-phosphate guanylyltransferase/mannose-6-phosphate isomerase